jgi:hypothetical protein
MTDTQEQKPPCVIIAVDELATFRDVQRRMWQIEVAAKEKSGADLAKAVIELMRG